MISYIKEHPYLAPLVVGVLIFVLLLVTGIEDGWRNLLLNISASLVTIPIVLLVYDALKDKAAKEQNKEVSNYVKMRIDKEILRLLDAVSPLIVKTPTAGLEKVLVLLKTDREKMIKNLESHTPIVYFLSTDWEMMEHNLSKLLSDELIHNNLNVSERNIITRLIKSIHSLSYVTHPRFFTAQGEPSVRYKVVKGEDAGKVSKFKNRYILMALSKKKKNEFVVAAFNDIDISRFKESLTTPMKTNSDGRELLIDNVEEIQDAVNKWLDSRGNEFILDRNNYKL